MDLRASSLPLLVISTKDLPPLNKTADLGTSGEEKETQEKIFGDTAQDVASTKSLSIFDV